MLWRKWMTGTGLGCDLLYNVSHCEHLPSTDQRFSYVNQPSVVPARIPDLFVVIIKSIISCESVNDSFTHSQRWFTIRPSMRVPLRLTYASDLGRLDRSARICVDVKVPLDVKVSLRWAHRAMSVIGEYGSDHCVFTTHVYALFLTVCLHYKLSWHTRLWRSTPHFTFPTLYDR